MTFVSGRPVKEFLQGWKNPAYIPMKSSRHRVTSARSLPWSMDMIKKLELWQSKETISYFYLCHNSLENAGSYTPRLYSFLPLDNAWTKSIKTTPWPEKCIPMLGLSEPDLFRHLFREQRQMNITTEILDIISGFEALTPDGR